MANLMSILLIGLIAFAGYEMFLAKNPMPFFESLKPKTADAPVITPPVNNSEPTQNQAVINSTSNALNITPDYDMEIDFIDVGEGDAILIKYPSQKYVLIDGGPRYRALSLTTYLENHNITEFDTVVATHWDADHVGGLARVFQEFKVNRFLYSDTPCNTLTCEEVIRAMNQEGSENIPASTSVTYYIDNLTHTQILNPPKSLINSSERNDNSVVWKITYKDINMLFTGDCTDRCEKEMISTGKNLDADILKIGHHGSDTSTSKEFIDSVTPLYAVISVGTPNAYSHPTKNVLERLINIKILRTDELGTIVIKTNGENFEVNPE